MLNNLPNGVVHTESTSVFKTILDKFWSNHEIIYDYHVGQSWESGRRYSADNIGLFNHCNVIYTCKTIEFGDIRQNNGYYAVQGHSRSPVSVPIERPYATSY